MQSSIIRTLRCQSCLRINKRIAASLTPAWVSLPVHRGYATSPPKGNKFNLPDEYTEEVFNSLANNPPVMQAMHGVIESFNRRGIKLDKEPSVSEMWKIMKDKELINSLNECLFSG
jgi:hypothetical protein